MEEEYLQRILSDYAIPLVVIDDVQSETKAYNLSKYFYPTKNLYDYYVIGSNFALLYYPEKQKILFFEYPIFSYLLVTKLTGAKKPTRAYYNNMNKVLEDLNKYKCNDTY